MKKIYSFTSLEKRHLSAIDNKNIVTIEENGTKKKFFKPLKEKMKESEIAELNYVIQKNRYFKSRKENELEKCETLYRKMIHSKINLIREHMFQMKTEEIEQARKTIDVLMSYSFKFYIRTWKTSVENGSKWVTEAIYP